MLQLFSSRLGTPSPPDDMKPGDRYCRAHGAHVMETATVLDVRPDLLGIPHVRFNLAFERSDADRIDEGPRTLALSRFVDEYRKDLP